MRPNLAHLDQSFRLRYNIFHDVLGWIPENPERVDSDRFDQVAQHFFEVDVEDRVVGTARMVPRPNPWMLDEFLGFRYFDGRDHVELSRLAVTSPEFVQPLMRQALDWCESKLITKVFFISPRPLVQSFKLLSNPTWPIQELLEVEQGLICLVDLLELA